MENNSINTEEIIKYITHLSVEEKESLLRAFPSNLLVGEIYNRMNAYEEKLNILKKSEKLDTLSDSITDKKIKEEIKRIIWE